MPYASCDRCDRIYVVPGGRSPRDECPVCACPMRPATPAEATAANAGLTSALGRLLAIAENYPQLKANENFIRLQDELAGSENRVAVERRAYNETVRAYNAYIKTFPNNVLAGMFGFKEREYFEADESAKEAPKVKF